MSAVLYAISDLIVTRLEAALPDLLESSETVPVLRAASIQKLPRNVPLAVVVVPAGIAIDGQRKGQAAIAESVAVVIQVRNPSDQLTGAAALAEAGLLGNACVGALLGWTPDSASYEALTMIEAPGPEFEAGFGYYPIAFQTRYILSGVES